MNDMTRIGFIGTGMIAKATIEAFCERAKDHPYPITIANRTKSICEEIKAKYPDRISVADSFQECVDNSDIVVVAVLPNAGEEVFKSLKFRSDQRIVTMISTMAREEVAPLINTEVKSIVHMIPGTFISVTEGPVIIYPSDAVVEEVFSCICTIVPLDDRDQEKTLMSLTGMFAPIFSVEDILIKWCMENGLDEKSTVTYTTALFKALAIESCMTDGDGIHKLATVNTPGGINMQAVDQIEKAGGFAAFADALDGILKRLKG